MKREPESASERQERRGQEDNPVVGMAGGLLVALAALWGVASILYLVRGHGVEPPAWLGVGILTIVLTALVGCAATLVLALRRSVSAPGQRLQPRLDELLLTLLAATTLVAIWVRRGNPAELEAWTLVLAPLYFLVLHVTARWGRHEAHLRGVTRPASRLFLISIGWAAIPGLYGCGALLWQLFFMPHGAGAETWDGWAAGLLDAATWACLVLPAAALVLARRRREGARLSARLQRVKGSSEHRSREE